MASQTGGASKPRVVVVGAGQAGVLMGHHLRQAGYDFTIYEKGASVGGVWRENAYPGLHCDVPSHHYCYSFAPNPSWTSTFSRGPEIWEYLKRTANRLGVTPHIRFNSEVADARWDGARWRIRLKDGHEDVADVMISATGALHHPYVPDLPGLGSFQGAAFHSTAWDHGIDLRDKRIGVVGTGSTAVQIIAELGGKVGHLTLFQRTAPWVVKAPNPRFSAWRKLLFRLFPSRMRREYETVMAISAGTTEGVRGGNPAVYDFIRKNAEDNLASVRDPELRAKLTPDYEVGCKRLIASPNFYEAIQHPTSDVVTDRIERIEPKGVRTVDGKLHELDVLALCTGFQATNYMRPMTMEGEDGWTIGKVWEKRPIAYHSMTVPHMPNFFMIGGPFSPIGNLSLILMSEWQVEYIMKCLRLIGERQVAMAPKMEVTQALVDSYREAAKATRWATGGCRSWYQDAEGVPHIYPHSAETFRTETRVDPNLADYEIRPLKARTPEPA